LRRADATALLALVGFVGLGLADGILGPAWPSIRRALDQPVGALGILVTLSSGAFAFAALGSARLRTRLGAGPSLALGAGGMAVALVGFLISPWWTGVLAAALVLGGAAAFVDVGFNAHAALHFTSRLTNALHASYGVGTTIGPLVVAAALAAGSWRIAFAVGAAVNAVVAAAIWAVRRTLPTAPPEHWSEVAPVRSGRTLVLLMLAVFFALTGVETAIGAWAPTLLADGRGLGKGTAAVWVAVYWGAFTAGRALLALAGSRVAPPTTLRAGTALALAGTIVFWLDPGGAGAAGLPLAGLGLAGLFPALVLLTPVRLGPERAAAAVGRQLAAATLGVTAAVALGGVVAQVAGVDALGAYLASIAAVLVAVELAAARAARPASARPIT
jgi:fucose permease